MLLSVLVVILSLLLTSAESTMASIFSGLPPLVIPMLNGFTPGCPPTDWSLTNVEFLETIRITRTVVMNGISDPTRTDDVLRSTEATVMIAVNAAARFGAVIGISYSPYIDYVPVTNGTYPPPTDTSFDVAVVTYFTENMERLRTWIQKANTALGTCVQVKWMSFDQETMMWNWKGVPHPEWKAAVTRKNDLIFSASKAVFPDGVVQWYGRGEQMYWQFCNCWKDCNECFTMDELGDSTIGPEMYSLQNVSGVPGNMVETFTRSVAFADAQHQKYVTPWLSLGSGTVTTPDGGRTFNMTLDYDPASTWLMGSLLGKNVTYPWTRAQVVGIYPSMLDTRSGPVNDPILGATTVGRKHFVAYAMGSAGLMVFPTVPIMNVLTAPVIKGACPAAPPDVAQAQLNVPALVGGISGLVLFLALLGGVFYYRFGRRKGGYEQVL